MEKLSPPVRIFALVAALAAVGGALFMFTAGRPTAAEPTALPVVSQAAAVKAAAARKVAAKNDAKATPKPARAAATAPKPALNAPQPATGFPVAIDKALAKHRLVVVSLVLPGARVDALAAAEARAGAKLSGAGYLALNVLNEDVAHSLLTKLGTSEEPSLLLMKRGGDVVLRLNGFVDRATVAQAAANAST